MKFGLVLLVGLLGLSQVAHTFTVEAILGVAIFTKVSYTQLDFKNSVHCRVIITKQSKNLT